MKYQYIKDMINARIAGTALHLTNESERNSGEISYKKYKIWGIKTIIKYLVEDIFDILYKKLPNNENDFKPEEDLKEPLIVLAERYGISHQSIEEFINQRKEQKLIWETLDDEQQAVFIINAFFEAIEENLIDSYFFCISALKFLFLEPRLIPKLKRSDFGIRDFGFIYRARGYAQIANTVFQGSFKNVIKRLNKALLQEYDETFILRKEESSQTEDQGIKLESLSEEKQYVIEMLKQGNSNEKLEAINLIVENRIIEALNELEYLLNHEEDKVMNAAFDAIVLLKDLE